MQNFDLFGNPIEERELLRERFIEPPFTILDAKGGNWQARKRKWKSLGLQSELGRDAKVYNLGIKDQKTGDISIFDPALCEVLYRWFCNDGGRILDPFAGGSVRGIVATYLGYDYTGIDLRPEQIAANEKQADQICYDKRPRYICGDSLQVLDTIDDEYDLVFSCPPYGDLEVYSDRPEDLSNMEYDDFITAYRGIIRKACSKLRAGGYAVFVVGEFRDKNGYYRGFVPDTIKAFTDSEMGYYNEAILLTPVGTAALRAAGNMKTQKLVKTHQNVLVFKKL